MTGRGDADALGAALISFRKYHIIGGVFKTQNSERENTKMNSTKLVVALTALNVAVCAFTLARTATVCAKETPKETAQAATAEPPQHAAVCDCGFREFRAKVKTEIERMNKKDAAVEAKILKDNPTLNEASPLLKDRRALRSRLHLIDITRHPERLLLILDGYLD